MDEEIREMRTKWRVEGAVRKERRWVVGALGLAVMALAGVVWWLIR